MTPEGFGVVSQLAMRHFSATEVTLPFACSALAARLTFEGKRANVYEIVCMGM